MAQITPAPQSGHQHALRRDLVSLLGAGQSFFNSLFSPDSTTKSKGNGKTAGPTPTPSVEAPTSVETPAPPAETDSFVPPTQQSELSPSTIQPAAAMPTTPNIQATATTTDPSTPVLESLSTQSPPTAIPATSLPVSDTSLSVNSSPTPTTLMPVSIAPSPTTASSTSPQKHSSKAGLIAAVVTIVLLLFISIAALVYLYMKRRRRREQAEQKSMSRPGSVLTISSVDLAMASIEKAEAVSIPRYSQSSTLKASLIMPPARLKEWGLSRSSTNSSYDSQKSCANSSNDFSSGTPQQSSQSPVLVNTSRPRSKFGIKLGQFNSLVLPSSLIAGARPKSGAPAASSNRFSGHELWFPAKNSRRTLVESGPEQAIDTPKYSTLNKPVDEQKAFTRKPVPVRKATDSPA